MSRIVVHPPHEEGSRQHVISYGLVGVGGSSRGRLHCSEPDCEINQRYRDRLTPMATETESLTRVLNHLQVGVSNGITPDNIKRVLIAHWPTPSIPDLTEMAGRVCIDLHRLIVDIGNEQAPLDFAAIGPKAKP